jgi:outer membrane immunogenic protein
VGASVRRNLFASTVLTTSTTLLTGAAGAADMAVKAPPRPIAPPFSWNGCYVGLNAGGAWVDTHQQVDVPGITVVDSSGTTGAFIGGGQIGCKWQRDPNWVFGLEGDIDYSSAKRTSNFAFSHGSEDVVGQQTTKMRWLSTVRALFGYALDRSLLYATGGLAIGEINSSVSATDTTGPNAAVAEQFSGSGSATRVGWTLGAGFEYAFTDRMSAKLEYLYFDLGNSGYNVTPVVATGVARLPQVWNATGGATGNIVRVGVNFRFN